MNSHLSWPDVAITARRHLLGTRRAGAIRSSAVLLRIGFTQPRSLLRAGELLPRLSTLTGKAGGNFLLHYPSGRPRRPLTAIPALWSSDCPQAEPFGYRPRLFSLLTYFILIFVRFSVKNRIPCLPKRGDRLWDALRRNSRKAS